MTGHIRLYPAAGHQRRSTITKDVVGLLLIALFAWVGLKTYQAIDGLTVFGTAVASTGSSIQDGLGAASRAVSNLPLVGGSLANALTSAGAGTGSNLQSLGQDGIDQVNRLALVVGLAVALLPILVLLVLALPRRIRTVRSLTAAGRVLANTQDPAARQLMAARAVFTLPLDDLLGYTADPLGDFAAGRYDALVDATLREAGLPAERRPQLQAQPAWASGPAQAAAPFAARTPQR